MFMYYSVFTHRDCPCSCISLKRRFTKVITDSFYRLLFYYIFCVEGLSQQEQFAKIKLQCNRRVKISSMYIAFMSGAYFRRACPSISKAKYLIRFSTRGQCFVDSLRPLFQNGFCVRYRNASM